MIPWIELNRFHLGPIPIELFGLLVAIGVWSGWSLATWRGKKLGLDVKAMGSFVKWACVGGFIGGHVLDEISYHPSELRRPWTLLFVWQGLSSLGGFIGTCVGGVAWKYLEPKPFFSIGTFVLSRPVWRRSPAEIFRFSEVVASTFPIGWMFGRMGCSLVHDHLGARVPEGTRLAVMFGEGPAIDYGGYFALHWGHEPRYDLGLLELGFTMILAALFALTWWSRKLPLGTYLAALCLFYAPVRFGLDFLRADEADGGDARWLHLTPAQYACIGFFVAGVVLARVVIASRSQKQAAA